MWECIVPASLCQKSIYWSWMGHSQEVWDSNEAWPDPSQKWNFGWISNPVKVCLFKAALLPVSSQWTFLHIKIPDSKVYGANMWPSWGRQDPGGPHVGPMNLAIWDSWAVLTCVIFSCHWTIIMKIVQISFVEQASEPSKWPSYCMSILITYCWMLP